MFFEWQLYNFYSASFCSVHLTLILQKQRMIRILVECFTTTDSVQMFFQLEVKFCNEKFSNFDSRFE